MAQIVKPKEEGGVGVSRASNSKAILTFKSFADELRDDLNDSITDTEVIEMLAQHLITKPVFDALFEDYSFAINIEAVYHSNMKGYDAAPTGSGRPVRAHDPCGAGTGALPRAGMNQAVGLEDSPAPTGQTIPAQDNALGLSQTENPSPEGASHGYEPFQDICLTDTFQLYEKSDLLSNLLTNNSDHHKRQKALDIRGIMGTSPYPVDNYGYTLRDAITDIGLAHFQRAYPAQDEGSSITKENLSYYIYSLLHSPDYRSRYADNLSRELPRIPAGKTFADFSAFSQAGRDLAHWHQNYETMACHPGVAVEEVLAPAASHAPTVADRRYKVTKMKFGKTKAASGKNVNDKTTVIYNETITLKNIPLAAYDCIVNGKHALEWVMERQSVTTDKDSSITTDANLWATETMQNPKFPLDLLLRVVTVSLETMKLVNGLPGLEI